MPVTSFLKSIYLGDRACKGLVLDSWNNVLKIQVDEISRVRGESWDFYSDEDIVDGYIVFADVRSVRFEPSGPLPNDYIYDVIARPVLASGQERWEFEISVASGDEAGQRIIVTITIDAADCYLEDPNRPGEKVR
jgi:hypothetical protein